MRGIVSEPDLNEAGCMEVTLQNVINCCIICTVSAEPDTHTSLLSFPFGVYSFLRQSKHKDGSRAVSISDETHQNANQKLIRSAPAYRAQCTLPPHLIYQTLLFNFIEILVLRLGGWVGVMTKKNYE